jgi:hypothetical protein
MKTCSKCKETKSLESFNKDKNKKDGLHIWCRVCGNKDAKRYRDSNPEKTFAYRMWTAYRLRIDTYNEMVKNGCEVCGSMEKLCIDHDHSCCPGITTCGNCIRGVLCTPCNTAEGMLESNLQKAKNMVKYIEKWENRNGKNGRKVAKGKLPRAKAGGIK